MERTMIRVAGGTALAAVVAATYDVVVRPRLATWGATPAECAERLPGDELVVDPATMTTRAITIDAEPTDVWPWLVQIGTDRGGWYSYDRLERLAGVPVTSSDSIRPSWQNLAEGDLVTLAPKGWMGLDAGFVMPVAVIVPEQSIVLRQEPPRSPWDGVWSFHVRSDVHGRCRLVIRSRTAVPANEGRASAMAAALAEMVGEHITSLMERGMLRGIRRRAESHRST
jgi:hypothetical protein